MASAAASRAKVGSRRRAAAQPAGSPGPATPGGRGGGGGEDAPARRASEVEEEEARARHLAAAPATTAATRSVGPAAPPPPPPLPSRATDNCPAPSQNSSGWSPLARTNSNCSTGSGPTRAAARRSMNRGTPGGADVGAAGAERCLRSSGARGAGGSVVPLRVASILCGALIRVLRRQQSFETFQNAEKEEKSSASSFFCAARCVPSTERNDDVQSYTNLQKDEKTEGELASYWPQREAIVEASGNKKNKRSEVGGGSFVTFVPTGPVFL